MPGPDGVGAGGYVCQNEAARIVGYGKEGVVEYANIGAHPRMHVTLDLEDILGFLEDLGLLFDDLGHGRIELWVDLGEAMDIVEGGIGIEDLHRLAGPHSPDVGFIAAAPLVQRHRLLRHGERVPFQTRFDAHQHVPERGVLVDDYRLRIGRLLVLRRTHRVSAHLNGPWLRAAPNK